MMISSIFELVATQIKKMTENFDPFFHLLYKHWFFTLLQAENSAHHLCKFVLEVQSAAS